MSTNPGDVFKRARQSRDFLAQYLYLSYNPFIKTVPAEHIRRKVFTDRESEMEAAISTILDSNENVLVFGPYGIGKTIFILECLRELSFEKNFLPIYTTLEGNTPKDFEECVLLALANAMSKWDKQAQEICNVVVGQSYSETSQVEGGGEASSTFPVSLSLKGQASRAHTRERKIVAHPNYHFQVLLKKSLKKYKKVIIAVDELEKREPQEYEFLLANCRPMLDLNCSFILTGGLWATWATRNPRSPASGACRQEIELKPFEKEVARKVIIAYLNSARKEPNDTVHPFTEEAIKYAISVAEGIPRIFNGICFQAIEYARTLRLKLVEKVDIYKVLQEMGQTQYSTLADNEKKIVSVMQRFGGVLSDNNIAALRELGIMSVLDIYPIMEALVQRDVIRKIETPLEIQYSLTAPFTDSY